MNKDKTGFSKFIANNIKPFLMALVTTIVVFIVINTSGL